MDRCLAQTGQADAATKAPRAEGNKGAAIKREVVRLIKDEQRLLTIFNREDHKLSQESMDNSERLVSSVSCKRHCSELDTVRTPTMKIKIKCLSADASVSSIGQCPSPVLHVPTKYPESMAHQQQRTQSFSTFRPLPKLPSLSAMGLAPMESSPGSQPCAKTVVQPSPAFSTEHFPFHTNDYRILPVKSNNEAAIQFNPYNINFLSCPMSPFPQLTNPGLAPYYDVANLAKNYWFHS